MRNSSFLVARVASGMPYPILRNASTYFVESFLTHSGHRAEWATRARYNNAGASGYKYSIFAAILVTLGAANEVPTWSFEYAGPTGDFLTNSGHTSFGVVKVRCPSFGTTIVPPYSTTSGFTTSQIPGPERENAEI